MGSLMNLRVADNTISNYRGEDQNADGDLDPGEDTNGNGVLDQGEDTNGDGFLNLGNGDGVLTPLPRLYNFADAYQPFDVAPLILYERIIE